MEKLSYQTLKKIGYSGFVLETAPEKVLQFGEGNFLRAFVDYWFDIANEKAGWNGKCAVVMPIPGKQGVKNVCDLLNEQEGLYTVYLRGRENGETVDKKRVISSISRCIDPHTELGYQEMMKLAVSDSLEYVVSNTTEAGIVFDEKCRLEDTPPTSYPAKLTQVLYARFKAGKSGLVIMPCELIDDNGTELRKCVLQYAQLWNLEAEFSRYVTESCTFCSTLVDRIVPGAIRDPEEIARLEKENGYTDPVADVGEVFGVWNIEGPAGLEDKLPFKAAYVNCPVVPDVVPYKKRKVRILNGAHTGFVLGAYLGGYDIVRDCMLDDTVSGFMNKMLFEEVLPILPLPKEDVESFAAAVKDRFNNPFINHELMSISLNSTSKWRARCMPSFLEYIEKFGKLPACLAMSFAAYIAFYSSDVQELTDAGLVCRRSMGNTYTCSDDRWALEFYYAHKNDTVQELVHAVMTNEQMWGQDLTKIPGFEALTVENLMKIRKDGAIAAFASTLQ